MLKPNLCHYSDVQILVKGSKTTPNIAATGAAKNNANKMVIFENFSLFTDCISKLNNDCMFLSCQVHVPEWIHTL